MDILKDVIKNEFLLVLLNEEQYLERLIEIVKTVEKTNTKICYVCLSKPYKDVFEGLKAVGIDTDRFFFIDVLTSHYQEPEPVENCIFLASPVNLELLRITINRVLKKGCSVVMMDTVSSLLIYQEASSIVRFTHDILTEEKKVKKIFIVLKGEPILDDNKRLVKDLDMFADKLIDMD